jgi:hypothetical protein
MNAILWRGLKRWRVWHRIAFERLSEPVHLNVAAAWAAIFGSFRTKVSYDLVIRQHHAFALLKAADWAQKLGLKTITAIEFGVANGAGLLNICEIAQRVTRETNVEFEIYGFDSGCGLPVPRDYRDHAEHYRPGDYPMQEPEALRKLLPDNAKLILGEIGDNIPGFLTTCAPIAFVSIDVDYYWSTVDAFTVFDGPASKYLPWIAVYVDDLEFDEHNQFCGEWGAAENFNQNHSDRKIVRWNMLRQKRVFQRALWIDHMFTAHIFDHPYRSDALTAQGGSAVLENAYLGKSRATKDNIWANPELPFRPGQKDTKSGLVR